MKISILGCGWLGLPLAKYLVEKGFEVKGSTTSESKIQLLSEVGVEPFLLQFSPQIEGKNIVKFLDSDILIICIPPRAGKFGDDFHVQQIESLVQYLSSSPIQSVIYTSSTSVYPELNREMNEDDEVIENHALVKVEQLLKNTSKNVTILRCGGLMGGERIPAKYFAGKTINTGKIPVNYVHREDVIAIITMILVEGFWHETYNVVSPEHPVREEIYLKNCLDLGLERPIFEEASQQISFKIISPQKLISWTNYHFIYVNPLNFKYLDI